MKISKYSQFFESFLSKDIDRSIETILSFLTRNIGFSLYPYDEIYHIQKGDLFLEGKLYLCLKKSKALRINWKNEDLRKQIHSIDIWENFDFEKNPEYTLELNGESITKVLPKIVKFFNNPTSLIELNESTEESTEEVDVETKIKDLEGKLKRARSPKRKEELEAEIGKLKAGPSQEETRELESDKITIFTGNKEEDFDFDVFKAIDLYTRQVAKGKSNSLIISGQAGVGKSQTVKDTLLSMGMVANTHYFFSTGTITTAGLYEILFKHRRKLIIFDDCDAVFKDMDSINMLKGALDTYPVRELAKMTKGNTFDSMNMTDDEIEMEYERNPQKLPNKFEFRGQIIFISNLPEDKFDDAILSRSLHVDVHLNKKQIIERMREIMKKINPDLDNELKEEALNYLVEITNTHKVKFDLNIRTLIHSINLRAGNEEMISLGGREEVAWKLLIKKYLVKK